MRSASTSPHGQIGSICASSRLSATTSETEVETALLLLLEGGQVPCFDVVRDLVRQPQIKSVGLPPVNLAPYDQLLGRAAHE
jgi:hypothetical protein